MRSHVEPHKLGNGTGVLIKVFPVVGDIGQLVECLCSMQEALGLIPSTGSEVQSHLWLHRSLRPTWVRDCLKKEKVSSEAWYSGIIQHLRGWSRMIKASLSHIVSPWTSWGCPPGRSFAPPPIPGPRRGQWLSQIPDLEALVSDLLPMECGDVSQTKLTSQVRSDGYPSR